MHSNILLSPADFSTQKDDGVFVYPEKLIFKP
jgi:hypothetical protein